jgi:hypothetical protein
MCTVLLPPGGNPIAVNKYISINIKLTSVSSEKELAEFVSRTALGYIIEKWLYTLTLLHVILPEEGILPKHGCNVGKSGPVELAVAKWHIVPAAV